MKKSLIIVLCICFLFVLCSCSSNSNDAVSEVNVTEAVESQEEIESHSEIDDTYIIVTPEEAISMFGDIESETDDYGTEMFIEMSGEVIEIYKNDRYFSIEAISDNQTKYKIYCFDNTGLCYKEMPLLDYYDTVKVQGNLLYVDEDECIYIGLHSIEFI